MKRALYLVVVFSLLFSLYTANDRSVKAYNKINYHSPHRRCVMLDLPALISRAKLSTVHIRVNDSLQGSGVIVDEHTVLTAGHIVGGAESVEITLSDGSKLYAAFWTADPNNDAGTLIFEETFLPHRIARMADSDSLVVGEPVLAVGSPYGDTFFNTISFGIAAGLDRDLGRDWGDVITADILCDPGYSGGPVFNMRGEVIGLVVGTYSRYGNGTVVMPVNICKGLMEDGKETTADKAGIDIRVDEPQVKGR